MSFEQWSKLAAQDPEGFEALRGEVIEAMIRGASQRCQQRLRGLQWQVEMVRRRSPNPMAACITLSKMMWETFAGKDGLAEVLNRPRGARPSKSARVEAEVIPLGKPDQ